MNATASGARLVLLPGLGADQRLFIAQRSAFPDQLHDAEERILQRAIGGG